MIDLEAVGKPTGAAVHRYTERDIILYHLGIGAGADDLEFVYERAKGGLRVCPTYAVIPAFNPTMSLLPRFGVPLQSVLHGEQVVFLERALPSRGTLLTVAKVPAVYDKGKAAVLLVETETTDEAGTLFFRTRSTVFCQGFGGFGGDPGPKSRAREIPADRPSDFTVSDKTSDSQAVLYRLSGDWNPLHVDPATASSAGFPRPILHGLCTFGHVGRAVLRGLCGNRVDCVKEFGARFSAPVFPGDTITTRGWKMGGGICHLRVSGDRGDVLSNAYVQLKEG